MQRPRELQRRPVAELLRDELLERALRPSAVLAARRRGEPGERNVVAASPVAGDLAECRKPDMCPVGADTDAVDARATGDRDSEPAFGAGSQNGERVVPHLNAFGPAERRERVVQALLLIGEVDAGQQHLRDLRPPPVEPGFVDQLLEHLDAAGEAEMVR